MKTKAKNNMNYEMIDQYEDKDGNSIVSKDAVVSCKCDSGDAPD